jgi:hypothetical protein
MSRVAQRTLSLIIALALAACSNPVSPVPTSAHRLQPGSTALADGEIAPDGTYCRNGYNVSQGRCN